jgi:hypothetical protein
MTGVFLSESFVERAAKLSQSGLMSKIAGRRRGYAGTRSVDFSSVLGFVQGAVPTGSVFFWRENSKNFTGLIRDKKFFKKSRLDKEILYCFHRDIGF